ncbi:MAG: glycoside hydrolase family 127 protein, partial [Planctomycetes bacterium]|nr:glycoside hydrolase family 127 protein [Planctomycetota bacterium]
NATAYTETCAAIANALWNHRMFLLHGHAQYLDMLERIIYNGFLAGVALSGDQFFYPNPLEADGKRRFNHGGATRQPWFGCACCPVNVVRFIPSLAGYVYATQGESLYVNLYVAGAAEVKLGGQTVKLTQQTRYPWEGAVKLTVEPSRKAAFTLKLRIPGWAQGKPVPSDLYRYLDAAAPPVTLKVNGQPVALGLKDGFAEIVRDWQSGDTVELVLPMPIRRVAAHEAVKDDVGRVALERGPIVYCVEGADHDGHVLNLVLPDDAKLTAEHRADLLGGVTALRGMALAARKDTQGNVTTQPMALTAIPYYAWCHRGENEMAVWLPRSLEHAKPLAPPTIASESKPSASHCWPVDSLSALNDEVEPQNSNDHSIPRFTWWDHRGTAEWAQYDFKQPTSVSSLAVYWFDDTGRGQCRVPQGWKVLCREADAWKPVEGSSGCGVARDQYNRVTFRAVTTAALRLEVQLQPTFSGGILEWRVGE